MSGLIDYNPEILGGKPIIKGTRIQVKIIYDLLAQNYSIDEILDYYPTLSREIVIKLIEMGNDIQQSLAGKKLDVYLEQGSFSS